MRHRRMSRRIIGVVLVLFFTVLPLAAQEYVLLGWNDLGMHCSNKNFSKVVVLPPYNTVTAQLVEKNPGQPPKLVVGGFTIEYSIPNNTYSVGKTDFWTYAQQLFGLSSPLPPDVGLTGKGMTGLLDTSGFHFGALGIPNTPFTDSDLVHESPFQLMHLIARRTSDNSVVATTDFVIPVSNEVGCVQSGCHTSENQILSEHDDVAGFNRNGPVLCASCHASNALGTTGIPEARPFSYRMHNKHAEVAGPAMSISTCYKCHPGPQTQCLRDIMGKNPSNPLVCQNCHGTMDTVANTILRGRRPWLDEPRCGTCHGPNYAEQPGTLYRMSTGHGGLYCSACHGSPHAIQPTVEANDNVQNVRLQGFAGALRKCTACHSTVPDGPGPHGLRDTTVVQVAPPAPSLMAPPNGITGLTTLPIVQWHADANASRYDLQIAADSGFVSLVLEDSTLTQALFGTPPLSPGGTYFWRVRSANGAGTGGWSDVWSFTTAAGGTTLSYSFLSSWNMLSVPMDVPNRSINALFPGAASAAFEYLGSSGYAVRDSLVPGSGYWVRLPSNGLISFTGQPVPRETVSVAEGWNIIGSVSDTVASGALSTIPGGILASQLFGYSAGYRIADAVIPSKAYWIKTSAAGQIILARGPSALAQTAAVAMTTSSRTNLLFEDAAGHRQVLYVLSSQNVADGRYDLPPLPPEGLFDIRFASHRYAESAVTGQARSVAVRLASVIYPLRLSWSGARNAEADVLRIDDQTLSLAGSGSIELTAQPGRLSLTLGVSPAGVTQYRLAQNSPNPFNPSTMISYSLPTNGHVVLAVYSILGQEVARLVDRDQEAGTYAATWDAGSRPSGIYFYRLSSGAYAETRKMLLLR